MNYSARHRGILQTTTLGILLACCWTGPAQSLVSVDSTTDGNGLFSYTFHSINTNYIIGVSDGDGGIYMQSHGILDVISPPGWAATVDDNEFITWAVSSGTVFVGDPALTFSVRSAYTGSVLYDEWGDGSDPTYLKGFLGGVAYTLPDHVGFVGGFENFSFLGPQLIPEPGAWAIFALGTLVLGKTRRVLSRRAAKSAPYQAGS